MSTWYAAHIVMYVEFEEGAQSHYPVWENIVLFNATSEQEAFDKAEKRGRDAAGDSAISSDSDAVDRRHDRHNAYDSARSFPV